VRTCASGAKLAPASAETGPSGGVTLDGARSEGLRLPAALGVKAKLQVADYNVAHPERHRELVSALDRLRIGVGFDLDREKGAVGGHAATVSLCTLWRPRVRASGR